MKKLLTITALSILTGGLALLYLENKDKLIYIRIN